MEQRMSRHEFDVLLVRHAGSLLGEDFHWGVFDCNTIALDWAQQLTRGAMHAAIGAYSNATEAREFCASYGRTLADVLHDCGFDAVSADSRRAQPGDLILVKCDEPWEMAHLCVGSWYLKATPGELIRGRPMTDLYPDPCVVWRWACRP